MRYRKLRIAWSVFWGMAAVLLCVIWVRSWWHGDQVFVPAFSRYGMKVESVLGRLSVNFPDRDSPVTEWEYAPYECDPSDAGVFGGSSLEFDLWTEGIGCYVQCPHWLPVLVFVSIAITTWIRWRFTTRTLLIAITAIGVGLGVIVWAMR